MQSQDSKDALSADKLTNVSNEVLVGAHEFLSHPAAKNLEAVLLTIREELRDRLETTTDVEHVRGQIRQVRELLRLKERLSRVIKARGKQEK